jgi:benzoylformate decarboxylase
MPIVREVLFDLMRTLDMKIIFGNIGSTEEPMLTDFPKDFRYILSLHEAVALSMADAYGQFTGKVVHVNLHTAAGTGNAMGAIQTAAYNHTAMIITAGQQTREMLVLDPLLTNKNPLVQAAPWVKWSYEPARAEDVPAAFLRAYAMAVQAPRGPVYLSLPMDDMEKDCPLPPAKRTISGRMSADEKQLEPVVTALKQAKSPVLVFGGAVDRTEGWNDAVALAEKLRCAVYAAPFEGRPGFPETHTLYKGVLPAAINPICEQLKGYDVVVVIGAPVFRYYPYDPGPFLPNGTKLFHITDNAEQTARAPVGDSFLADPASACAVLAKLLPQSSRELPAAKSPPEVKTKPDKITPDQLFSTIAKLKPADAVITHESLSNVKSLKTHLPTSEPCSFLSMDSAVLGYGLPAAVGVALAEKDSGRNRKVIALQGDGATQYAVQAFWNAAKEKSNVLFVILRNREYNILKSFSSFLGTDVPALDITGIDTVKIAAGYGCEGKTVSKPEELESALKEALAHTGPFVLQVEMDPATPLLIPPK